MKKTLYILSFTILGLLAATVIHAVVELFALQVIFGNPERFADSFWWIEWTFIHSVFSFTLWLIGVIVGAWLGIKWWKPYGSKSGLFHFRKKA